MLLALTGHLGVDRFNVRFSVLQLLYYIGSILTQAHAVNVFLPQQITINTYE